MSALTFPLVRQVEPCLDAIVQRRLELVDLVLAEDVVGKLVPVLPHPFEAAKHLSCVVGLGRGAHHAELPEFESDPVVDHRVYELKRALAEGGERRRAAVVVDLVAVRPEADEPRRQPREVARPEVERGVRVEKGAKPVDREAGLGQRARLGRRDPAAVPPRRGRPGADVRAVYKRDVDISLPEVVRAAKPRDAGAHDDHLHDGMPAVTSISTSMPGVVNPVTIVVRTGRGGGKYSAQSSFQAPKSDASSR